MLSRLCLLSLIDDSVFLVVLLLSENGRVVYQTSCVKALWHLATLSPFSLPLCLHGWVSNDWSYRKKIKAKQAVDTGKGVWKSSRCLTWEQENIFPSRAALAALCNEVSLPFSLELACPRFFLSFTQHSFLRRWSSSITSTLPAHRMQRVETKAETTAMLTNYIYKWYKSCKTVTTFYKNYVCLALYIDDKEM